MTAVEVVADPGSAEQDAILRTLEAYNEQAAAPADRKLLAIVTRDGEGTVDGGLWGTSAHRWLFIQYLAIPEAKRGKGLGRALMLAAEGEAIKRDCIGVWLDTFSFQARGFYERVGYEVVGQIDDYPPGHSRFFMRKRIKHD